MPLPWLNREAGFGSVLVNWGWAFIGNLIGSVAYGALWQSCSPIWGRALPPASPRIVAVAEAKTIGYAALGTAGMVTAFVKAMLCNRLVCLAIVLAMTTSSTVGKIACAWMPIFIVFAQGFEHSVVNMVIIPTGMMMGTKVSLAPWWLWNQIPVSNIVGGFVFTGLALYATYKPRPLVEGARAGAERGAGRVHAPERSDTFIQQ